MEDTTNKQKQMERSAFERSAKAYRTFNDIMTGPSPLTQDEIKRLIEKRPELWGRFRSWAK